MAYLAVKAKADPALQAALDAITAISQQNGNGHAPAVEATVTASAPTAGTPVAATVTATTVQPPAPSAGPTP
jgi:hypothetical protein